MSKVLVIEADPFLSKFYAVKLKKLKHEVDVALNGEEALRKLKLDHYDGVLMGLILPYRDGFELLRDMNRMRKKHTVKVIATELQDEESVQKAFKLGASAYFIKSNSQIYEIIEALQALLHGKALPEHHGITLKPKKRVKKAKRAKK